MEKSQNLNMSIALVTGFPGAGKSYFTKGLLDYFILQKQQNDDDHNNNKNVSIFQIDVDIIEQKNLKFSEKDIDYERISEKINLDIQNNSLRSTLEEYYLFQEEKENNHKQNDEENKQSESEQQHKQFDNQNWKKARDVAYDLINKIIESINLTNQSLILLVDDDFLLKSMRKKYFNLAFQKDIGFCEIFINNTLENCLQNNRQRQGYKRIQDEVLISSYKKFEIDPLDQQHYIEIESKVFKNYQNLASQFLKIIQKKVIKQHILDEQIKLQSIQDNKESLFHQIDLQLRKFVGFLISKKFVDQPQQQDPENQLKQQDFEQVIKEYKLNDMGQLKKLASYISFLKKLYYKTLHIKFAYYEKNSHNSNQQEKSDIFQNQEGKLSKGSLVCLDEIGDMIEAHNKEYMKLINSLGGLNKNADSMMELKELIFDIMENCSDIEFDSVQMIQIVGVFGKVLQNLLNF